jgi:hypothetical protein
VIIRRGLDGRAMMRTANLLQGLTSSGNADLVPLRRFDVVYVPRSGVAEAGCSCSSTSGTCCRSASATRSTATSAD